ncbi:LysR family transcriptional regulator [Actinocrispum wychmicini]|uniref:DNA-binding transcriptional LysR family regulator n=1 Tax=Actinocrispum wychmicini TaxID=1213861 RepID=A0A4R2JDY7_9PSEU|nr:LysR substrate-binding domain-containing protein [Actinocrispum wychmicini]TCO55066.1 DNA-binding transcriptional LysR family regulator [Actinocrispum wychmicini]
MELRQLAYFVAVVDEANFTRAAARMHVAQPGVSAQIRQLERELGHELLDRGGRSVQVTEVGAAVLPFARAALAAVEGARLAVDELAGLVRGHVALGMITSHAFDIPGLLAGFHDDHPAVEITLSEANSDVLVRDVLAGRLDAAIIGYAGDAPEGLGVHVLVDEPIVAAVAHSDPLARTASLSIDALRDRLLICLPLGTGVRSSLEKACAQAGFRPHVAFEAGTPPMLAELARRGLGMAILPESLVGSRPELHGISLAGLRGTLALVWRGAAPGSPAGRALVDRARQVLRGT